MSKDEQNKKIKEANDDMWSSEGFSSVDAENIVTSVKVKESKNQHFLI